jgi:16S rRNA (cytidine1402-2'-O)-methyltransferase
MNANSGTLYVIATPIGNMADITLRALEILKKVDYIACEDTRHSGRFLAHHGIHGRLISYYDAVEERKSEEIVDLLRQGFSIALISDSGMPLVSDPGYRVVRRVREEGLALDVLPGPSAFVNALVLSGLAVDRFAFLGFLPVKRSKALRAIKELELFTGTVILYESPHRLLKTLDFLQTAIGLERVVLAKELTKMHQSVTTGTIDEVRSRLGQEGIIGEYVILFEIPERKG